MSTEKDLGKHKLSVKLIVIPEQIGRLTVKPAINVVQYIAHTPHANIILYAIEFETAELAKKWYNEVKKTFKVK